MHALV